MQEITKYTQEKLDNALKKLSEFAYDIDDESRIILGLVAKNGISTETRITSLGKRRILLSRDKIRRRLLDTDLSEGFVSVKKGKKIGNLKGKREQLFSLTFKGILASLYETKLSENYWIKNYISEIEKITNKTIAELFLQNIYHCIILHFLVNVKTEGSLTYYDRSQKDISGNYYAKGYLHYLVFSRNDMQGIRSEFKQLFVYSAIEFYVLCTTISNLLYDLKLPSKFLLKREGDEYFNEMDRKEMEKSHFMILFFEDWMYTIFDVIGKTFEKVFNEDPDHNDVEDESLNFEEILEGHPIGKIEELAKKLYLKLNPNGKFERAHTFLSPRPHTSSSIVENSIDD